MKRKKPNPRKQPIAKESKSGTETVYLQSGELVQLNHHEPGQWFATVDGENSIAVNRIDLLHAISTRHAVMPSAFVD